MHRHPSFCTSFVVFAIALLMSGACSRGEGPFEPALSDPDASAPIGSHGNRSGSEFDSVLAASDHSDYSLIASTINGAYGGSLEGTVVAYKDTFQLSVPADAYTGIYKIKILVPNSGVPVFRLQPHGVSFDEDVTVVFDYSHWIGIGGFDHGDSCEVFYMDEVNEEFDALSPPAVFVADSLAPTVSFDTDHFSRWVVKKSD